METIKVETPFKGLYTNAVDRNISYSYFADMDKVKVTKQYIQSEEYKITEIGKAEVRNVVESKVIYLDDDKFWYENKLLKYEPDFQKHYVVFTNTAIKIFAYDNLDRFVQIFEKELSDYISSFEINGTLRILTKKGIFSLQYKRINQVKTLVCEQINNGKIVDNLSATVSTSLSSEQDPEVTFEVIPQAQIYWLNSSLSGDGLYQSSYRIPVWSVIDDSTGTPQTYECYYGTIYLVRVKNAIFNIPTQGFYDWLNQTTFLAVPVDIVNGQIKIHLTSISYLSCIKSQNSAFSLFDEIKTNPSLGLPEYLYVDHNNVMQFNSNALNISDFLTKFRSTLPLVETEIPSPFTTSDPVFLSDFLNWISNPDISHRIIGTYTLNPTEYGFDVSEGSEELLGNFVQTVVLNGTEEYIIAIGKISTPVSATRVIYSVQPIIDLPILATHTKLYIGFGTTPTSYELLKSVELFKSDKFGFKEYFGYLDLTGILLSNTLAIYGDIKQFTYITSGESYVLINNIGFLIKGGTVYYSPNDMTNSVFYKNRYIPNIYGDALISIGGMLGVIRYNKDVTLISIQVIENEIYFKVYDTVSFVIKNRYSYLEIPDGVLMSLREGLYLSTPQNRELLSEPINDIFESGNASRLLYDDYNRRIMVQSNSDTYVFDLINKVWIKYKGLQLKNIAFDGEDVITIDGSSFAKVTLSNETEGEIIFHKVNLGSNKITKRLVGLRIDLEGNLTTFENSFGHHGAVNALNEQLGRRIEEFYLPINKQLPETGLDFKIKFKGKIYGMEVLYDMVGEFVNTKLLEN